MLKSKPAASINLAALARFAAFGRSKLPMNLLKLSIQTRTSNKYPNTQNIEALPKAEPGFQQKSDSRTAM